MQTTSPAHATHNRASSTLLGNAAPELDLHQEKLFLRQRSLRLPNDGVDTSSTFFPHNNSIHQNPLCMGFSLGIFTCLSAQTRTVSSSMELEALCCATRSSDPCEYRSVKPNKSVQPTGRWSTWPRLFARYTKQQRRTIDRQQLSS
jgi:hypothetical protein